MDIWDYHELNNKMKSQDRKSHDFKEWDENYFKPGEKLLRILPQAITSFERIYGNGTFKSKMANRSKLLYRDSLVNDFLRFGQFERAINVLNELAKYDFLCNAESYKKQLKFIEQYKSVSLLVIDFINQHPRKSYRDNIVEYIKIQKNDISTEVINYFLRNSKSITIKSKARLYSLITDEYITKYKIDKEKKEIRAIQKKSGEFWVKETELYKIILKLFKKNKIYRHYRPEWLQGLELDIYIPALKLGFEYQGQQHYQPIEHWGGENAFISLQNRDRLKAEICEQQGIFICYVDYTEPLTEEHIKNKIIRFI